ncbi:OsmC family protein [Avibacterium sp. 20-129]|uniref:OsmC family protein n=1 Tax=Avibacterium sp. 20-129 TaxID=2911525 RepID=UPI002247FF1B|nr:OsmC family protein [Avibacterium sp. 20-129]MCW9699126.1 OsmC family protein [Avibacterium sp. 20-129]
MTPFADVTKISELAARIQNDAKLGEFTLHMSSESNGGVGVKTATGITVQGGVADNSRVNKFITLGDEPQAVLGEDRALSPMEYVLQALAGCYTATLTLLAAGKGIELSRIDLKLSVDFDLNGFLKFKDVRSGASQIRVDIHLESPNTDKEKLDALVDEIANHSPVYDTLVNPVNVINRSV